MTDVSADIMAQAISARAEGDAMAVDWRRVPRSAFSSLLSDDLPFLLWSRGLWEASERIVASLQASTLSPRLVKVLTNTLTITAVKTIITQLVYETSSNAAYLSIQAWLRGGGWRAIGAELSSKFLGVWWDGVIFWSFAHIVVFSMPIWWLQPIADNLFTLVFNTYLAFVAYKPVEGTAAKD